MIAPKAPTVVSRVRLRNYKSIAGCDVELSPLTFLVGPNGAGKSNFLDALRFVGEALSTSLDHALRDRAGVKEVRRRSTGHPTHFGIALEFRLPSGAEGSYSFRIAAREAGGYEVQAEACVLPGARFRVRQGQVENGSSEVMPPASADRLYLVNAAGLPAFRPAYDVLTRMGFYNLVPERMRALQAPDPGDILKRDGSNLSSVLGRLARGRRDLKQRIEDYLAQVVPGVEGVDPKALGNMETLEFRQRVAGADDPWRFPASSMSDGTLRTLGVLVALFQGGDSAPVTLVGIEEPEVALHPAAAEILRDCLREASRSVQVLVTSHSPELLDSPDVPTESILAVVADGGTTEIGHVDQTGRTALGNRLFTAGELLRLNQLAPDREEVQRGQRLQLDLFGGEGA